MKKKRNLYIIAFLCFITLVGVTIAYLQSTSTFENIFNAGTYQTVTHEEFISPSNWVPGDTTPKTITTTNEGTIPVRVRVKLEESWTSKNDEDLPLTHNNENVAIINFDNEVDWILKDGYYYYTKELEPGESTTSLVKSVSFNPNYQGDVDCTTIDGTVTCETTGDGYDGGTYKLKITTETIQAKNYEIIWEDVPVMYDYLGDNPCTFDGDLEIGAEYVNGQYTYKYRYGYYLDGITSRIGWFGITDDGWGVKLTDPESSTPVTTTLCSSINNKPIVSMSGMFTESVATSIDLSSFDTSNVTSMEGMFFWTSTTSLDFSSFDTSRVTNMDSMFNYSDVTTLDLSSFDTSNVTKMSGMFLGSRATSINLSSFDTSNVTSMDYMFSLSDITTLDLDNFDTSKVTDMSYMFQDVKATTLDLSSFDTSSVTNMEHMFENCEVESLDLSNFNTSNVTTMEGMFYSSDATVIVLSSFDTSNVENMDSMFAFSEVTTLNLSNFDTSKVTSMDFMFRKSKVTTLDLSSFDTSNVTSMISMFISSAATTGYARTQADADRFNATSNKPSTLTFVVKGS